MLWGLLGSSRRAIQEAELREVGRDHVNLIAEEEADLFNASTHGGIKY